MTCAEFRQLMGLDPTTVTRAIALIGFRHRQTCPHCAEWLANDAAKEEMRMSQKKVAAIDAQAKALAKKWKAGIE